MRVIFYMLLIGLAACGKTVSQSVNVLPNANNNSAAVKPVPSATPETNLSECAEKRIYGLPKNVNIPQELCVDLKKPIDKGEDVTVEKRLTGNVWKQENDIPFAKLPAEVQNIIRLTTGKEFTQSKYNLSIILSGDESQSGKRSVKTYRYFSADGEPSWDFKRQDKTLKLDSAQIKAVSMTKEEAVSDKVTFICNKSRSYALPANSLKPNVPLDLCFDDKKPVDSGEIAVGNPHGMVNDVTLKEESGIDFAELPPEVQNVIRLTSGEKYVGEKFNLDVLVDSGDQPDRPKSSKTKDYLYYPGKEIKNNPSWTFKRQNNLLKLTQASLEVQK